MGTHKRHKKILGKWGTVYELYGIVDRHSDKEGRQELVTMVTVYIFRGNLEDTYLGLKAHWTT